ncbi:DUF4127 family protein [Virgibacillus kekensis]|uniref:DUF4127 family protein n=1 Tax=Virgibacillus kekensis TaxID=202261 RepID=A0ABV9DGF2_9BACI
MNKQIAIIPVDARPVTYDLPRDLAKLGGWEAVLPPKDILGFLKEPAELDKLDQWIDKVAPSVDGMIVSMDMVLYGGLVPSRVNTEERDFLLKRLEGFLNLKRKYPKLKLMAFSSTMRLSNSYVNQEEKDYWDIYGKEIWKYSFHSHRSQKLRVEEDEQIVQEIKEKIPRWVLEDYETTRERNFQINLSLIDYIEKGMMDLLIFPQDDTSEFGFNIQEQERLSQESRKRKLFNQIYIYPGADEVASVLTARMIYELEGERYPTFYPIYSGTKGSLSTAMYEDRAIQESVKGQVYAFGSHTVESPGEADIIIGVNVPGGRQGDLALQMNLGEVDTNDRNIGEWGRKLRYYLERSKPVAVADVAYANGADTVLIDQLLHTINLNKLSGFAAWNTAGNTLGTTIAQSALVFLANQNQIDVKVEKGRQLLLRYLDDYLYQSITRQKVRAELEDEESLPVDELTEKVKTVYKQEMEQVNSLTENYTIEDIYLPWNRTFEIGIQLTSSNLSE